MNWRLKEMISEAFNIDCMEFIKNQNSTFSVIVDNDKHLNCTFCPECHPKLGDKIIAKSTRQGIKVHTMHCKALKTISFDSLLEAHWDQESPNRYHFELQIKFSSRELTIVDFLQVFSQFNVQLSEISIKHGENAEVIVDFELQVDNPSKIAFILKDLKKFSLSLEILKKVIF